MSDPQSMGDLFRQRRAAAAAASQTRNTPINPPNTTTSQGSPNPRAPAKSFAEIQREQQQQQAQQQHQRHPQQREQPQREREQRELHSVDDYGRLARPTGGSSGHGGNPRGASGNSGGGSSHHYSSSNASSNRRDRNTTNNRGRDHQTNTNHRSNLPIEQGIIHTLLDKFGFILCADRDKELFFHYSELVKECHSEDLNIGDEVEFRLGRAEERGSRRSAGGDESEKWSAFDISKLPKGTICWEKEDKPGRRWKGTIDRVAREEREGRRGGGMRDRGGGRSGAASAAVDGAIRISDDTSDETVEIYYAPSDYKPTAANSSSSRTLAHQDVVEFTLVTLRRTSKKYARDITLVRSERERRQEEREAKMLEDATLERGRVVSVKGDFGFLRSTTRVEEVYFHVSHILPEDGDAGDVGGDAMLKEGQDVEFYVINESVAAPPSSSSSGDRRSGGSKKPTKSLGARKIRTLPAGSVQFERTIAKGVTGTVIECPVASVTEGFGRRDDRRRSGGGGGGAGGNDKKVGKIRLQKQIAVDNDGEVVTHVTLHPDMYPGGTFAISRTGSEVGSWIRPGDVLLFDVVLKAIDGSCRAVPTEFARRASQRSDGGETAAVSAAVGAADSSSSNPKPAIRLVEPSLLCGRSEGIVRSIHDNYGFVHFAERNVDVYFPLFEVFPPEIQMDLLRNSTDVREEDGGKEVQNIQNKGGRIHVEVGMEVAFDLSLQMLTNAGSGGGGGRAGERGRYNKPSRSSPAAAQEKESLRARRIQILPKGTVQEKIPIASGLTATMIKEDPKGQPFVGTLELEDSLKVDSNNSQRQRHPLVAKLLDAISEGKYDENDETEEGVMFGDVLSEKDAQLIISMVNSREENDLEWSYVIVPEEKTNAQGESSCNRKLCIGRKKSDDAALESANNEASDDNKDETLVNEGGKEESVEKDDVATAIEIAVAAGAAAGTREKSDSPRKKGKKTKIIKALRFDKFSFPDMGIAPIGIGDVVTCDIYQSRQSGAMLVENITVVERKERSAVVVSDGEDGKNANVAAQRTSLTGFVTEAVPNRQFGFITAVDEQGAKTGEHVFFHFREVESPLAVGGGAGSSHGDVAQDGSSPAPSSGRSKKPGRSDALAVIRKGDEVKFDIAKPGKNGKVTAMNVSILPRGTLKMIPIINKADSNKSSCTGYILMEPSHTSFVNTPSHNIVLQSGPSAGGGGGSRWDNVRSDKSTAFNSKSGSNAKGGGVILLLSDPLHLFSPKHKVDSPSETDAAGGDTPLVEDAVLENASSATESNNIEETDTESNDAVKAENTTDSSIVFEGTHLLYKPSSIMATRGFSAKGPKRGDLVSFGKTRGGAKLIKDIRIEKVGSATSVRGVLTDINKDADTAVFVSSSEKNEAKYEIKLTEVVSCDKALLKDKEEVDGILHEGKIFGVCRTKDIYIASSFGIKSGVSIGGNGGSGLKERPKLNLTVKKELQGMGGKIMAQSRMAKGPDGTNGFAPGWTTRVSLHVEEEEEEEEVFTYRDRSLSAAASEFVPNFPSIAASGFESMED